MNNGRNKKGQKYAFNINDINKHKKFKGSLVDFNTLNKGTYDEIENNDMTIKDHLDKLKVLKNRTIKELVYTNKDIPYQWRNKLDYKTNLLKIFIKDTNFLSYLGNSGPSKYTKIKKIKKNQDRKIINNPDANDINKINIKEKRYKKEKETEKISNPPIRALSTKTLTKFGKFKDKHNYTDKQIINILEDFKSDYPILIKEKNNSEIYMKKRRKNIIDRKSQTLYEEKNKTFNAFNTFNKRKTNANNFFSLPNLKLKNYSIRSNTFRQNIFTNLLPPRQYEIIPKLDFNKTTGNFGPKNCGLKFKNDLNLDSNNEIFDKKININNPTVIKYLEGINFYGPYFSYCPPCGNKNLEFYKNLEQKQCLQIIQQIKKNKGSNVIFREEKKFKEKIKDINNSNYMVKNDSESYDIKIVKNKSDSMIQQFSENASQKV